MGYWSEFKEIVSRGVDIALDNIKDGAEIAKVKGKEGLSYLQLKKDLIIKQRKLHDHLTELGEAIRGLYKGKKDIYTDKKVKDIMEKINRVEDECNKLEEEIKSIGSEEKKAGEAAAAKAKEEKAEEKKPETE